jgi:hypothetical protein
VHWPQQSCQGRRKHSPEHPVPRHTTTSFLVSKVRLRAPAG